MVVNRAEDASRFDADQAHAKLAAQYFQGLASSSAPGEGELVAPVRRLSHWIWTGA